jgi:hydroxymethylpyrimidine pyrophosphatase-like HAD family hydrolase
MQVIENLKVVVCDIDDTLLFWDKDLRDERGLWINGDWFVPNTPMCAKLRRLKARGHVIILWSRAGGDWARDAALALKIDDIVDYCFGKPVITIDDSEPNTWMGRRVLPGDVQ